MSIAHTAYGPNFKGNPDYVWVDRRDLGDKMVLVPNFPHSNGHGKMNPWKHVWDPRLTQIRRRINGKHPERVKLFTNDQEMYESKLHFPHPLSSHDNDMDFTSAPLPSNYILINNRNFPTSQREYMASYLEMQRQMQRERLHPGPILPVYPSEEYYDYDPEDAY
jgi:hypothetical protein